MTTPSRPVEPGSGTCACIAEHARTRPEAVAIVHRGVNLTWRTLAANLLAVVEDLERLGVQPGQILGIEIDDRYLHLLIILAGEVLGVTTMSLNAADIVLPNDLGRLCDRIIASRPSQAHAGKTWLIPPDWPVQVLARVWDNLPLDRLHAKPRPDAVLRLMMTSGTTGRPKVMGMSQALLDGHVRVLLRTTTEPAASRPVYLCLYRYTVRAVHTRSVVTLRRGGTIHFTGLDAVPGLLRAGVGNYLLMLSGDLERLVHATPAGIGPFDIHIDIIGGTVSDALREAAHAKLSPHIVVSYATNETHVVALMGEGGRGHIV
ncbi:MAG: AMP-binding protein, partial [Proteobacteria bacterium]|nr:AMP-binding protein [Pseudomonadota bacterium]